MITLTICWIKYNRLFKFNHFWVLLISLPCIIFLLDDVGLQLCSYSQLGDPPVFEWEMVTLHPVRLSFKGWGYKLSQRHDDCLACTMSRHDPPKLNKLGMVVQTCDLRTWLAERPEVQSHLWLYIAWDMWDCALKTNIHKYTYTNKLCMCMVSLGLFPSCVNVPYSYLY